MTEKRYIHISRWDDFQHYKDRDPKWIKVYTRITRDDRWLALTGHRRAILLSLWLEYAVSHCGLRLDTRILTRRLNLRVTVSDIEALNHAGFLDILASETVPKRTRIDSPEVEKEKEPPNPRRRGNRKSSRQATPEPPIHTCPTCQLPFKAQTLLDEHLYTSHGGPEPEHWAKTPAVDEPPTPELELPPPEERHRIAEEVRAQLIGVAARTGTPPDNGLPPLTAYLDTEPAPEDVD